MNEIVGWIVGNTQGGPHAFRKKRPHGWQYSDALVTHSYHEAEVARLRAELANANASIESKAGWEWKNEADRLRAEVEAYRKDADRWDWIMSNYYGGDLARTQKIIGQCWTREQMEDAIDKDLAERVDAAMGESA